MPARSRSQISPAPPQPRRCCHLHHCQPFVTLLERELVELFDFSRGFEKGGYYNEILNTVAKTRSNTPGKKKQVTTKGALSPTRLRNPISLEEVFVLDTLMSSHKENVPGPSSHMRVLRVVYFRSQPKVVAVLVRPLRLFVVE